MLAKQPQNVYPVLLFLGPYLSRESGNVMLGFGCVSDVASTYFFSGEET